LTFSALLQFRERKMLILNQFLQILLVVCQVANTARIKST
jgi:hypothetical protein